MWEDKVRFSPLAVITGSAQPFRREVSMFIVPTIACFPAAFLQPLGGGEAADRDTIHAPVSLRYSSKACRLQLIRGDQMGLQESQRRDHTAQAAVSRAPAMSGPHS